MDRNYRYRNGILTFIIIFVAFVYMVRLFTMQLSKDESASYDASNTTTYTQYVPAARGMILDRHGNILVGNRATYSVTLQGFVLYNSDDPNGYLLSLAKTCLKHGIEYEESLPLSKTEPYSYVETSDNDMYYYKRFLLGRQWDADMTAENLYKRLRDVYNLEEYTDEEARLIMGLRYELDLPTYANADAYTVVEDIDAEQLAILKELGIPGMDVVTSTVREYNTKYAAQLLGHVGAMDAEEYEGTYKDLGYSMDATVGKDGFEYAFEEYLHGVDGQKVITVTSDGTVVDEYWAVEPQTGANVVVSLDIGLQELAERSLANAIENLAASKTEDQDGYDVDAGSVVVMNVNTGEVLAAANYPTYDPADYNANYKKMAEAEVTPLANRCLNYAYPPGSTFKPLSAITALRHGYSDSYEVEDTGYYDKYGDYKPRCWIYSQSKTTHGVLDMRGAIANSCNMYFYTVGDAIGIDALVEVAESFGVGQYTGSEVPDNKGTMATKELKKETYTGQEGGWYGADNLTAYIGQSLTTMTPLQMCRYCAAMANGGTLYNATFLRRAVTSDFQSQVASNSFTPVATGLLSDYEYTVIKEGMRMTSTEGTAKSVFADYEIEVCSKTGTASHGSGGSDNGAFICWAPMENPEIAISIYVEHGASGSNFATVARDVMDYYFGTQDMAQEISLENEFLED